MGDWFYEGYKRRYRNEESRRYGLFAGRSSLLVGILLLVWSLVSLPYHADFTSEISGEALKAGEAYYLEDLQILDAKVDDTENAVYCVGKFQDQNQKDWIISFNPRNDEHLVKRIQLAMDLGTELNIETSGYVYLDENLGDAKIFYSSHSKNYGDADEGNILKLQADYLCDISGNFTVETVLRPGYIRAAFFVGIVGIIYGICMLLKYRTRR